MTILLHRGLKSNPPKKVCTQCGVAKPLIVENWVPNRPHKVGRPDLPRGCHNICRECESSNIKAGVVKHHAKAFEYRTKQLEDDIKKLKGESD